MTAARASYIKVPFELAGDAPRRSIDLPAGSSFEAADRASLVSVMAEVLESSLDAADLDAVTKRGPSGAAEHLLDIADGDFRWEPDWWRVLTVHEEPAGCVLPVLYRRSERPDQNEATIFHMGVRPRYRGQRFGKLLLAHATNTLLAIGVWRIYCDTASNNRPMIIAFSEQGWTRRQPHEARFWA